MKQPDATHDESTLKKQTGEQYRAIAHMARQIAHVYGELAGVAATHLPVAVCGPKSARLLETLGDVMNGDDIVEKEDEWVNPILENAYKMFPDAFKKNRQETVSEIRESTPWESLEYLHESTAPRGQWADQAVHSFVSAMLSRHRDDQLAVSATRRDEQLAQAVKFRDASPNMSDEFALAAAYVQPSDKHGDVIEHLRKMRASCEDGEMYSMAAECTRVIAMLTLGATPSATPPTMEKSLLEKIRYELMTDYGYDVTRRDLIAQIDQVLSLYVHSSRPEKADG